MENDENDREWFAHLQRNSDRLVRLASLTSTASLQQLACTFVQAIAAPQNEVQETLLKFMLSQVVLELAEAVRPGLRAATGGEALLKLARADARQLIPLFIEAVDEVAVSAARTTKEPDLADRAARLLSDDVASCRTVGELASRLNCHPRRLQEVFRGRHHMTVHRYLDVVRATEAVRLIRQEGVKVEAAALAVGLRSRTTLYKLIRRTTGQGLQRIRTVATRA